ncbi:glycosylphosphatidylinositol anchor attachment 1 protein-like [Lineus longissimus]|uniref:glycosylphosphatidylinositol anchor attachment 1 protein-like n=1 Tax=Lineus longissimus TaxID=88925 RepID=UPI002B4EA874
MGFLTGTSSRARIVRVVLKSHRILTFLCYFGGIAGFLAMAYFPFNNRTYFSENALLQGLVDDNFNLPADAKTYYDQFMEEVKKTDSEIPHKWLKSKFREIGLDTYTQTYHFKFPYGIYGAQMTEGYNVYGILRAPKAASTEAVVLSAPYRRPESALPPNFAGVALMYALAKYFRRHTYWAKDIIFLVTDHEQIGMQAWLDGYHNTENEYIFPGEFKGHSGSIQAAINLEIQTPNIRNFDFRIHGLNGQLPNLDLVNLAIYLCEKHGVPHTLHNRGDHRNPVSTNGYFHSLKTYTLMMWNQAHCAPSGNHGLFHRYRIEALTLSGIKNDRRRGGIGFANMGKVIEGIFRSLNNLLERFHQSFFFYLLPASHRYVSIGNYMPGFGVLGATVVIEAFAMWLSSGDIEDKQGKENGDGDKKGKKEKKSEVAEDNKESPTLFNLIPTVLMSQLFGLVAYFGPNFAVWASKKLQLAPDEGLALSVTALQASAMMFPLLLRRRANKNGMAPLIGWRLLKSVALLFLGVILFSVSVMNISLAFFLAVTIIPAAIIVRPCQSRILLVLQGLFLLLSSPVVLIFLANLIQTALTLNPVAAAALRPDGNLFTEAWLSFQHGVFWTVIDGHLFGNWLFSLMVFAVFPCWLLFWAVLWGNV